MQSSFDVVEKLCARIDGTNGAGSGNSRARARARARGRAMNHALRAFFITLLGRVRVAPAFFEAARVDAVRGERGARRVVEGGRAEVDPLVEAAGGREVGRVPVDDRIDLDPYVGELEARDDFVADDHVD